MVFEKDFMETIKYPNMVFEKLQTKYPKIVLKNSENNLWTPMDGA